jgi:hypothetical protein
MTCNSQILMEGRMLNIQATYDSYVLDIVLNRGVWNSECMCMWTEERGVRTGGVNYNK